MNTKALPPLAAAAILLLAVCLAESPVVEGTPVPGWTGSVPAQETPTVNLDRSLREPNYAGGSCVWASITMLLRWQGEMAGADYIRGNYWGGAYTSSVPGQMDRIGMKYAYVGNGDARFLEWACQSRRGAAVVVRGGRHCVCLVHLTPTHAGILDNNSVSRIIWRTRESFMTEWRESGGWAFTPVYTPPAPLL